ncbi:MAG: hypothetical protein AUI16_08240 [Alphaproteobacteria bacterium 13_2_20CM_2_64_7]|nr:MAG: hypothetical protein AUI16_08240 [Alphaproteobacteria bacterium 13_2_20CM_2_64_7]
MSLFPLFLGAIGTTANFQILDARLVARRFHAQAGRWAEATDFEAAVPAVEDIRQNEHAHAAGHHPDAKARHIHVTPYVTRHVAVQLVPGGRYGQRRHDAISESLALRDCIRFDPGEHCLGCLLFAFRARPLG